MGPTDFVSALYGAILGSGPPSMASYTTLEWPGLPVDPQTCGNIWATDNQTGSPEALEAFSGLVDDDVPALSPVYQPAGISLEQVYALILQATVPAGPVAIAFAAAQSTFRQIVRGSLENSMASFHPSTPNPRTWCDAAGAGGWTSMTIGTGAAAPPPPPPATLTPVLTRPAILSWRVSSVPASALHLAARPPIQETTRSGASAAAVASARVAATSVASLAASRSAISGLRPVAAPVARPTPATLAAAAGRLKAMPIMRAPLPVAKVVTQPAVQEQPVAATQVSASFRYMRVGIQRPWLDSSLFHLPGWSIDGLPAGCISNGQAANNPGMLPLLPLSFIAVKDVTINGSWSDADKKTASTALASDSVASFGPFTLHGGAGGGSFDGSSLKIPGIQVIAWICQVTPKLPPA